MGSPVITQNAQLMCAHGGTVQHVPGQFRVKIDGQLAALQGDQHVVAGCTLSSSSPSFCVALQWTVSATRVKADGKAVLTQASAPLGRDASQAPLGPAQVLVVQPRVKAT